MESDTMSDENSDVNLRQYAPDVNYENLLTVLEHSDYEWKEMDYDWSNEYVFETELNHVHTLRLYSSIDRRDNDGRGRGKDRFRLILIDARSGLPLMPKAKQKNRVIKWRPNLLDAMDEVADPVKQINECPRCGRALVKVALDDDHDKDAFWSCSSYHDDSVDGCGYTADIEKHE